MYISILPVSSSKHCTLGFIRFSLQLDHLLALHITSVDLPSLCSSLFSTDPERYRMIHQQKSHPNITLKAGSGLLRKRGDNTYSISVPNRPPPTSPLPPVLHFLSPLPLRSQLCFLLLFADSSNANSFHYGNSITYTVRIVLVKALAHLKNMEDPACRIDYHLLNPALPARDLGTVTLMAVTPCQWPTASPRPTPPPTLTSGPPCLPPTLSSGLCGGSLKVLSPPPRVTACWPLPTRGWRWDRGL